MRTLRTPRARLRSGRRRRGAERSWSGPRHLRAAPATRFSPPSPLPPLPAPRRDGAVSRTGALGAFGVNAPRLCAFVPELMLP